MKIKSATIRGYKRFDLNPELHHFNYEAIQKVQIVIGTNSSGKSSFVSLFTMFPIDHAELKEDGFVNIVCEKDKHIYELTVSKNGDKGSYSFLKDGEELNKLHRITVQKTLVAKVFGMTQALHSLLVGEVEFTTMTPNQRRKWIVDLSSMDYDYILGVYTDVRDKITYYKGVLKHNNKRIVAEVKILDEMDTKHLKSRSSEIHKELDELLEKKNTAPRTLEESKKLLKSTPKEINSSNTKSKRYMRSLNLHLGKLSITRDSIVESLGEARGAVVTNSVALEDLKSEMGEMDSKHPTLGGVKAKGLTKKLVRLKAKKQKVVKKMYHTADPEALLIKLVTLRPSITETILLMDTNVKYSDKGLAELEEVIESARGEYRQATQCVNSALKPVAVLDNAFRTPLINCPDCNAEFKANYDKDKHDKCKEALEVATGKVDNLKSKGSELTAQLTEYKEQLRLLKHLKGILVSQPLLFPVWKAVGKEVSALPSTIEDFILNWGILIKNNKTNSKIVEIEKEVTVFNDIGDDLKALQSKRMEKLLTKRSELIRFGNGLLTRVSTLDKARAASVKLEEEDRARDKLQLKLDKYLEDHETIRSQSSLSTEINKLKIELSQIEAKLTARSINLGILEGLREVARVNTALLVEAKDLYESLSPVNGFIAHTLLGFLTAFIDNLNLRIKDIWAYPLSIQVPKDEELTFRFKLHVDGGDPKSDIIKGSSAIKQIINMSFILAVMDNVGLSDHPILLDEIGGPMDTQHSINVYKYIMNTLVKNGNNQVFIISHDPEMYSVFDDTNSDYFILDKRNIDMGAMSNSVNSGLTLLY